MTGVSVPGLDKKISGLLFADDAVILSESADDLQKSLNILTEWCKRWDMNVNSKKCGIMAINCSTDTTFKIQNQLIPSAGTSCNWMGLKLVYPELKTHIKYMFKIRNGTYWTAQRYAKSGFIEKKYIEECPFCRKISLETIEHMLLEFGKLLGEELKLSSTRICSDPTVLCVKTTLATAKFLNAIAIPRYLMLSIIRLVPIPCS
ncbi:hypothetical protein BB561_000983 [Smittium simulii]|uniref:Reverse transcriptase domain-containing protein n=1 Tax=Smittium simulii TaxID=133385 RepID=A0A2T9YWN9_9FUNG|nr:hypothetical protein BB561_000983 [Smittium simulii]